MKKLLLLPKNTQTRYIKLNWLTSVGSYVSGNELTVFASSKENQPARVLKDSKTGVQVHLQDGETAAIDSLSVRHKPVALKRQQF